MYLRIDNANRFVKGQIIEPSWNYYVSTLSPMAKQLEDYIEFVRQKVAPHKASRLKSVFAFDINAAENFSAGKRHVGIEYNVYELTVNQGLLVTEHNYNVISHLTRVSNVNDFSLLENESDLIVQYWTGNENTKYLTADKILLEYNKEYLIQGNATVIDIR